MNVTPAYITASCQGHSANEIWISTQVNDKASRIVLLSSTESGRRLVPAYSYPYDRANQPDEYGELTASDMSVVYSNYLSVSENCLEEAHILVYFSY